MSSDKLKSRSEQEWLRGFLAHHPELCLGKLSGLDPKWAQAFNEVTVERHFELLRQVMDEHGIPWEHVYNMDEKGIHANFKLVTAIKCMSADGRSLKPAIIFARKDICMSQNGGTAIAQKISDAPLLLIYGGHSSHASPHIVELARQHNIHLFCLPPHTTHKLQPLNIGTFGPLQEAWVKQCDGFVNQHQKEMDQKDIV
ncbi:hypothetical protein PYCCODRAFT_1445130 [Trametes coccinea BRFM310]|uniref:DDE-1 domain-containing protein n=1 Tax=Trametes coccinea (strain BRFM310) TaxID=1353009 RepID=A0A1Y2IR82_TRAC3|nr:hypothetical protein PYCCODRAFT_1445130 [Trametes coccinea BRFM310]